MLRVPWAIPFDELSEALACKEIDILLEWIWATLNFPFSESLNKEVLDTVTLTEFFGPYTTIGKGFCTLEGLNTLFSSVAYFLSEGSLCSPQPPTHAPGQSWLLSL